MKFGFEFFSKTKYLAPEPLRDALLSDTIGVQSPFTSIHHTTVRHGFRDFRLWRGPGVFTYFEIRRRFNGLPVIDAGKKTTCRVCRAPARELGVSARLQ